MDPLVSVTWLADRLRGDNLVVLDATLPPVGVTPTVDTRGHYLDEHIPGAVFFDIEALSDHKTPLPHMLPSADSFAASLSAMGVGDGMDIVVYEQEGVFSAPRAWWMLRVMGARAVYVLDGGLRAWREAGYALEAGEVTRPPAVFHATLERSAVRSLEQVRQIIASARDGGEQAPEQIVDARPAGRFAGSAPEPRPGIPSGHMPGAISVPSGNLVRDGRLLEPSEARALFSARGLDLGRRITTTCGSGVTAAVLALALERCGAREIRLYDGSWAEYAQQPDVTIQRS